MSDIGLTWSVDANAADFSTEDNDLSQDDGLDTSVMLSLFTDRQAEPGDILPAGETDRRGWWADAFPVVAGDKIGSRLWLLARAKQTAETLTRADEYAREALAWLVEDKVASRVDVLVEYARRGVMGIQVSVVRPKVDPVKYRFNYTWASQEARDA